MGRFVAGVLLGAVILAACSSSGAGSPPAGVAEATCDAGLDAAFSSWEDAGFSGTVAIATGGELDCLAAYGTANETTGTPNTVETVFSIGSISKAFTAAAVLDLVDEGRLSLGDRAGEIQPGLSGPVADVTVEQLLLHTGGLSGTIGRDHEPLRQSEALGALGELELAFEPGSEYLYSNAGYSLLALIVEEAAGTGFRDHVSTEILPIPDGEVAGGFWDGEPSAPGPRAVGYLDDGTTGESGDFDGPHWALDGNGGLAMTAGELAMWTDAYFAGHVVSPGAVELAHGTRFDHGPGLTAAEQSRVFERFWSGRTDDGAGLGLPIARQIALAHGGDLTVTSPGPAGDGCVFRLRLPR